MDDDDKIRRNLMVTSAVIIGAAWFDVSLPDVLERLFSIKTPVGTGAVQLSNWKVWLAALVALGYMGWRYRWSDEVEEARKLRLSSIAGRYTILFHEVYMANVAEWFKRGSLPDDAHPQLSMAYAHLIPDSMVGQFGRRPEKVWSAALPAASIDQGNHAVNMFAEWGAPGKGTHLNQETVNVYIDEGRRLAMLKSAQRYVLLNSKASMSLVWPVVIAGCAALVVLYKLARAIWP